MMCTARLRPRTWTVADCKDSRVHGTRPRTRAVHCRVHDPFTARVHDRTRPSAGRDTAVYTAVFGSRTDHIHGLCTASYTVGTHLWTAVYTCTRAVNSPTQPCSRSYRAIYGSCTRVVNTVVYMVHGRGRVHAPRSSYVRPYTRSVHGCEGPYMAVYRP